MKSAERMAIVAVDIGNSRIKLLYKNHRISFAYDEEWLSGVREFLQRYISGKMLLGISSVEPQRLNQMLEMLPGNADITYAVLNPLLSQTNMPVKLDSVKGIGADRILGLYGALARTSPPFITVDCGTAITINVLDEKSCCLGGAILPGIHTQLRALHTFTGQLPVVSPVYTPAVTGRTTQAAMRIGAIRGAAGAVDHIIDTIRQEYWNGKTVPLFITGGDAALLLREIPQKQQFFHRKDLVREGIIYCTQRAIDNGNIQ
jgi:pantothenate kinase type III